MNRGKLRELFKSLIDDQSQAAVFSDDRINALLYEGAQNVQDLLEENDDSFFMRRNTIAVSSDQTNIFIDTELRQLHEISMLNEGYEKAFRRIDVSEFPRYRRMYSTNGEALVYSLINNEIVYPMAAGFDHTIEISYTRQLQDLITDTSEWADLPAIAQRLVAYEAALIALIAEDSDARQFASLVQDMRIRVLRNVDSRDKSGPRYVNYREDRY